MQFLTKLNIFLLLLSLVNSSHQHQEAIHNSISSHIHHQVHMITSSKLVFEIRIHGLLLWAAMGFLMPLSILVIRTSVTQQCGRKRLRIIFLIHALSQTVSLVVVTIGAAMSIKNFNNSFDNHHQRIGLALYGIIWLQALIGLLRPHRGSKGRIAWFSTHWLLGTALCILGIVNIYTGLLAYHQKTGKSIKLWTILFTIQISFVALFYLFQDKWVYIRKQGLIFVDESMKTSVNSTVNKIKESMPDPQP
ncbi:hypothetical protein ACFE04_011543 [Oxalis oulophora]